MHKLVRITGAGVAIAALALSSSTPATGSRGADADQEDRATIRVLSTNTEEDFIDAGRPDFSLGDAFIFSSRLTVKGKRVGHTGVVCTITSTVREESQCVGTASLRRGQITIQGLLAGERRVFSFPITGGSGAFEGAEGTLVVREVSDSREILTFHLSD